MIPAAPFRPVLPPRSLWVTLSAIAATVGTGIGFSSAFFLRLMFRDALYPSAMSPTALSLALFRADLLTHILTGICVGLAVGVSLSLGWVWLIAPTAYLPHGWFPLIIGSSLLSFALAYGGSTVIEQQYGRALLLIALMAGGAGVPLGLGQSVVLWSSRRARIRWSLIQSGSFAIMFVILSHASVMTSSYLLLPCIWLAAWGIYGGIMGVTFHRLYQRNG